MGRTVAPDESRLSLAAPKGDSHATPPVDERAKQLARFFIFLARVYAAAATASSILFYRSKIA